MLHTTVSNPDAAEADLLGQEDYVQLVTPEGERHANLTFDPWVADVTDEQLAGLYEDMVVVGRHDRQATPQQRRCIIKKRSCPRKG